MAGHGRRLLGEPYGEDCPTYERIEALGLEAVTEKGEEIPQGEFTGRDLVPENHDEAGGYAVTEMETLGRCTTLCCPRRA